MCIRDSPASVFPPSEPAQESMTRTTCDSTVCTGCLSGSPRTARLSPHPGLPLLQFSLIFSQASHTSIFGMSYDLPCNLGSLTRLIPLGLTAFINQDGPSPWLHPHYRASQLLRDGPPACPATGTLPLTDSAARGPPSRHP